MPLSLPFVSATLRKVEAGLSYEQATKKTFTEFVRDNRIEQLPPDLTKLESFRPKTQTHIATD
jgi:hypothetical protein